jgi:hypothetical protein
LYLTAWASDVTTNTTMANAEMTTIRRSIMTANVITSGLARIKTITKTSTTTNIRKTAGDITITITRAIATTKMLTFSFVLREIDAVEAGFSFPLF